MEQGEKPYSREVAFWVCQLTGPRIARGKDIMTSSEVCRKYADPCNSKEYPSGSDPVHRQVLTRQEALKSREELAEATQRSPRGFSENATKSRLYGRISLRPSCFLASSLS